MKITKTQLKQIIKEELALVTNEGSDMQESADSDFGSELQALIDRARSQGTPRYEIADLLEYHAEEIRENPDALERRAQMGRSSLEESEESPEMHDDETKTILKDLVKNMQNKFNVSEEDALEAISTMIRYMER